MRCGDVHGKLSVIRRTRDIGGSRAATKGSQPSPGGIGRFPDDYGTAGVRSGSGEAGQKANRTRIGEKGRGPGRLPYPECFS